MTLAAGPSLVDAIAALVDALEQSGIAYALGGAVALTKKMEAADRMGATVTLAMVPAWDYCPACV